MLPNENEEGKCALVEEPYEGDTGAFGGVSTAAGG